MKWQRGKYGMDKSSKFKSDVYTMPQNEEKVLDFGKCVDSPVFLSRATRITVRLNDDTIADFL